MLALHQDKEAHFPKKPVSIKILSIDERTGHHYPIPPAPSTPSHKKELCPREHLPLPVSTQDYDQKNHALLSQEYAPWFNSPDNTKSHAFALTNSKPITRETLKFLTPLPNATYYLDPELPGSTTQLTLLANLPDVTWSSKTLIIKNNQATLIPGKHSISLQNPKTGQVVTCQFQVESL
jgi:hypothetical protein